MSIELSPMKCVSSKQPYQTPSLVCYGALRDLTQSGTGTMNEGGEVGSTACGPQRRVSTCINSDARLKEDVVFIGRAPQGFSLYLFHYKQEFRDDWGHGRQFGVMADEIEAIMPDAVSVHPNGYKMVDYDKLGITRFVN